MLRITKTQKQINEVLNRCADVFDKGTRYHGMSYEEGVEDALRWAFDTGMDEPEEWPFEDEQ